MIHTCIECKLLFFLAIDKDDLVLLVVRKYGHLSGTCQIPIKHVYVKIYLKMGDSIYHQTLYVLRTDRGVRHLGTRVDIITRIVSVQHLKRVPFRIKSYGF